MVNHYPICSHDTRTETTHRVTHAMATIWGSKLQEGLKNKTFCLLEIFLTFEKDEMYRYVFCTYIFSEKNLSHKQNVVFFRPPVDSTLSYVFVDFSVLIIHWTKVKLWPQSHLFWYFCVPSDGDKMLKYWARDLHQTYLDKISLIYVNMNFNLRYQLSFFNHHSTRNLKLSIIAGYPTNRRYDDLKRG